MRRRAAVASALVAVLLVVQLTCVTAEPRIPWRATTAVILMVTGAVIVLLTDAGPPDAASWFSTALSVLAGGSAVLALGIDRPVLLLTMATAATLALWAVRVTERTTFADHQAGRTKQMGG